MTELLNLEQQLAVTHIEGPLLVLAGAGSGKTRIVTYRIVHLLQAGIPPHAILALTFTNKAAGEMKERVHKMTSADVVICTFHSLGVRILKECLHVMGYQHGVTIYDEEDSNKVLKTCLDHFGLKDKEFSLKVFKNLISNAKNQLISPESIDETEFMSPVELAFPKVYSLYQCKLKEYNAVDFDDLLYLTVRLLRENPDILERYQSRWRFLLIDEYQDTNHAQYTLVRLLVEKNHNLFVVGDPDQSIYSWRGANIKNIMNFQSDFAGAKVVRLEQNYRSRSNILNAANDLIVQNMNRYEKNLWSELGEGEKLFVYIGQDERKEAEFVAHQILQLKSQTHIPLSQMVIFYRTNFQSRVFEDALLRKKIPYIIVGGISFYHRREIKDILSFMRLIHSGSDFVSFLRTINIPKRGFGEASLEKIRLAAESERMAILPFCEALASNESSQHIGFRPTVKQRAGLNDYIQIMQELRQIAQKGTIAELVAETIKRTRYLDYIKLEDKDNLEERLENLQELVSKASEWETLSEEPSLGGFLEELSLKSTLDEVGENEDRLNLMTLHNGKGLEFQAVFLVGMEEDLFPHANARGSHEALEEERRLCYVGMTRAKEYLYFTAAESRYLWGTARYMRPSRFLSEIPKQYIQKVRMMYELPFET